MTNAPTPPDLTGSTLDRAAHLRDDPEALAAMRKDPSARALVFSEDRPLADEAGAAWLGMDHPLVGQAPEPPVFLGLDGAAPRFAALLPRSEPPGGYGFAEMRGALLTGQIAGEQATRVALAKAITGWHLLNPFCARCGTRTTPVQGGWRRDCPGCGASHFPRTDPVAIMLVVNGEEVAIARNVNFPEGFYSLIAGFVEPGEAIEEAVRRETYEELGLRAGRVRYLSSQPWPFPAGLMLGCIAETDDRAFTLEAAEIADAVWLDRARLARVMAGEDAAISPPRRAAIAGTLLRDWLEGRVGMD